MKKILFVFLLSYFSINAFAEYGGYIGSHDNRRYGSLEEPEYNGVIKLTAGGAIKGTGVFVSKNIILTNSHCIGACRNGCNAEFWNGDGYETSNLKVITNNVNYKIFNGTDWGLLLSDKDSNFYKPIAPMSSIGQVQRGGYGILRIIEDDEIPFLKELYAKITAENREECKKSSNTIECFNRLLDKKLIELGKKPLFKDVNNFKVQTCNIIGNTQKSNKMIQTDCDSAGGDSGAPLLRNNMVVGLNNAGLHGVFGDTDINAVATKTENFYLPVQGFIDKYQYSKVVDSWQKYVDDNKNNEETLGSVRPDSAPDYYEDESDTFQSLFQNLDCD